MNNSVFIAIISSGLLSTALIIFNEWIRRSKDIQERKNQNMYHRQIDIYDAIVGNLDFMYRSAELPDDIRIMKRNNFLKAYRLAYLYVSDSMIDEINKMVDVLIDKSATDDDVGIKRKKAIASVLLKIRKYHYSDTKAKKEDFRYIS